MPTEWRLLRRNWRRSSSCFPVTVSSLLEVPRDAGRGLVPVVLVGSGSACALTCWRRLGALARTLALVVSELPFAAGYLLIASVALAPAQGDLDSEVVRPGVVAVADLSGCVIIGRALRADRALGNADRPSRPWTRILRAPLPAFRRDVARTRNLSYGKERAAASMSTLAVTGPSEYRSWCTSTAAASGPAIRTVKPDH